MITEIPGYIFLFVIMFSAGYIAGNAKRINIWNILLLSVLIIEAYYSIPNKNHDWSIMTVSLIAGFLITKIRLFLIMFELLYIWVNYFRFGRTFKDNNFQDEEFENFKDKSEQSNNGNQEYERSKRQEEARNYRQKNNDNDNANQKTGSESTRDKYIKILGLDPSQQYTSRQLKNAYRKQASKYHPDKHQGQTAKEKMTEKFKEISEAYKWLMLEDAC